MFYKYFTNEHLYQLQDFWPSNPLLEHSDK